MLMKSWQLGLLSISQVFGIIKVFDGKLDHKSSCCILIASLQSHTDYFTYASGEKNYVVLIYLDIYRQII